MSVAKGPKTGTTEFAGVDITSPRNERNHSVSDTLTPSPNGDEYDMPDVDLEYAANLKVSRVHGQKLLWMITFVCGTGVCLLCSLKVGCYTLANVQFICFGYDQGVLSSLLTLPSFIETFPETASGFGSAQSLLVAICTSTLDSAHDESPKLIPDLVGCMFGALLNLYVGDWLGRKKTIYV